MDITLDDSFSTDDTDFSNQLDTVLVDSLTVIDDLSNQVDVTISDSINVTDTLIKNAALTLGETIPLSETLADRIRQVLSDNIILTDVRGNVLAKSLFDSMSLIDRIFVGLSRLDMVDFIILTEWFDIKLDKVNIWTLPTQSSDRLLH